MEGDAGEKGVKSPTVRAGKTDVMTHSLIYRSLASLGFLEVPDFMFFALG